MANIHYFPRYSQRENVITNNTLLLLLRLYDYDQFKFGKFLRDLLGDETDVADAIGLQFQQQRGTGASVADGFLSQSSIKLVVETKRVGGTFNVQQLRGHLAAFANEEHKLLVLLSPSDSVPEKILGQVCHEAAGKGATVLATSFDRIIAAALGTLPDHDEEIRALVEDFAVFCSEEGLLRHDKHTMFVPPCGKSLDYNVEFSLYHCPSQRTQRRVAYLGIYKDKEVQYIGRIAKVVTCDVDLDAAAVKNPAVAVTPEEAQRIVGATQRAVRRGWPVQRDHKFFLCDGLEPTAFRKTSPGGIQGHRYFDLAAILGTAVSTDVASLAKALRNVTWE